MPKKNSRIFNTKTKHSFVSAKYREWFVCAKTQIEYQLTKAKLKGPFDYVSKLTVTFEHDSLRRRDPDNQLSSVLDLLRDCGIIEDDNWRVLPHIEVRSVYNKAHAGCTINIDTVG